MDRPYTRDLFAPLLKIAQETGILAGPRYLSLSLGPLNKGIQVDFQRLQDEDNRWIERGGYAISGLSDPPCIFKRQILTLPRTILHIRNLKHRLWPRVSQMRWVLS
jgi:hypothetical protein